MTAPFPGQLRCGPVTIEPFGPGDIGAEYLGWLNDPEVVRFSNQRFAYHDRESALRYLAGFSGTENLFLAVRDAASGALVGTMTAYRSRHHGTADVGIMIGARVIWGRGYGDAAWSGLLDWLLRHGGARKVTAGTLACNRGMVRLAEKASMTIEGVRRAQEIVEGSPEDIVLYAKFVS